MELKAWSESDYMPPREAARELGVSVRTLSRMGDEGSVAMMRLPRGHRRYLRADIERVKTENAA